jgi:undecaprenyl-diphosphatase
VDFASAVVLGLMQGVLEWLPVSSQGQLAIVMVGLLGVPLAEALRYSIWVHAGTLASAVVYFRGDLAKLRGDPPLLKFLLLATAASALVGAPIYFFASGFSTQHGALVVALIGAGLVATGASQLMSTGGGERTEPGGRDAVVTGVMQGFSALPGVSRSGTTTSALLLQGFRSDEALRLSFLLSIPLVLGADVFIALAEPATINAYSLLSAAVAFITGLVTIGVVLRLARRIRFGWFCILMGAVAAVPLAVSFL